MTGKVPPAAMRWTCAVLAVAPGAPATRSRCASCCVLQRGLTHSAPRSAAHSAVFAQDKQFTNERNSCANIDLDKNGNILAQAITGRDVQGSGASMGCYPKSTTPTISSHSNANCKCTWKSQLTHTRGKCLAKEGKWASLNKQGCTVRTRMNINPRMNINSIIATHISTVRVNDACTVSQ